MKKQSGLAASGRKLSLSKKTISNLPPLEMGQKVGGGTYWATNCNGGRTKNGNTCYGHNTCNGC